MAKIKLQVLVLPSYLADTDNEHLKSENSRKFLHFSDKESTIAEVCESLKHQYQKIYSSEEQLSIDRVQDADKCDLDVDYTVGDVFNFNDIIRILINNDLPVVETSFSKMHSKHSTPNSNRTALSSATQSTPLLTSAPVLTTDSALMSSKKRTEEYFEKKDANIPHKSKRAGLGPNQTNNSDTEETYAHNFDDSNVSLPPPTENVSKIIPTKRAVSQDTSQHPKTKRITSGMLKVPIHTQLETQQAASKVETRNQKSVDSSSSYSSSDGEDSSADSSPSKNRKSSDTSKKSSQKEETVTQEELLKLLDKKNGRIKHGAIDRMKPQVEVHPDESAARKVLKSLSIAMQPSQIYPMEDRRGAHSSSRLKSKEEEKKHAVEKKPAKKPQTHARKDTVDSPESKPLPKEVAQTLAKEVHNKSTKVEEEQSDRPQVEKILHRIKNMDKALSLARHKSPSEMEKGGRKHVITPESPTRPNSKTKNDTKPLEHGQKGAKSTSNGSKSTSNGTKHDSKTSSQVVKNDDDVNSDDFGSDRSSYVSGSKSSSVSSSASESGSSESEADSSSGSDSDSQSESDYSDSAKKRKIPRLAEAVSSKSVKRKTPTPFVGYVELKSEIKKEDESPPQVKKAAPKKYRSGIRKPVLKSLNDLAKQGVPDVKDGVSSKSDKASEASSNSSEEESSDSGSSDSDSSDSDSKSDSDSDSDGVKFLKLKSLRKKKPKSSGLKGLMSDARKKKST